MLNKLKALFAFSIIFALFGCTQVLQNNTGSLRIDVSGLPADSSANIMLSGPGYSRKLSGSSTIDGLKPDRYIISANDFSTNSIKYEAVVSQSPIQVEAGKTGFVTVKYSSQKLYQITVSVTGPGRVKSSDGKIDCSSNGARCSYSYKQGSTVVLTASANNGAKFVSWAKDNTEPTLKLVADSNQTVSAEFVKVPKPDITDPVPSSFNIVSKLNEKTLASFSFENKGIDDLEFSIVEDVDWLEPKLLNGKLAPGKKQAINLEASCGATEADYSTSIEIKSNDPDEATKTVAFSLKCEKEPAHFDLNIVVTGSGKVTSTDGNIDCTAQNDEKVKNKQTNEKCSFSYSDGTKVDLTASPDAKFEFDSWSGDSKETTAELSIVMDSSKNLGAKFISPAKISDPSPTTLTIQAEVNKSSQASFSFSNLGLEDLTYTISDKFDWLSQSPAAGNLKAYKKQVVMVTANCPANAGIYTDLINIASNDAKNPNKTITVNLECTNIPASKHKLTINVIGPGSISSKDGNIDCNASGGNCSFNYEAGSNLELTASPEADAGFDGWSQDGSGNATTLDVVMDKAKNITATFATGTVRTLTVAVNGPGTVTSNDGHINCSASNNQCSYEYDLDSNVSLTASPDSEAIFNSWSGDCTGSAACQLTISKDMNVNASFGSTSSSNYSIDFVLLGSATETARKAVFEAAAENWKNVIVGSLSSETVLLDANQACGFGEGAISQTVDGLLIVAAIVPIDGEGGILGQAGPRYVRSNGLPVVGCMQFDEADISYMEDNGSFNGVIMHEMGHVIGIGTLWEHKDLLNDYQPSSACKTSGASFTTKPSFTGANGLSEYAALGGSGNIPVEDEYGLGTRCGHWDEETFKTELMTGFANAGAMPLSRMTAASLKDLGYEVDMSAADNYSLPSISATSDSSFELNEILIYPEFQINTDGEIINLR